MKTCYFCRGKIESKKIDHVFQSHGKYYLFKNIKADTCTQCGEAYFLPKTLKYMDRALKQPKKMKQQVVMSVFKAA